MLAWSRRRGFHLKDLRRLIDHIEDDGGVSLWFDVGADARDYADVRFYLKNGDVSEIYYTLVVHEDHCDIERVSRDKV